jgi:hypothetical protein
MSLLSSLRERVTRLRFMRLVRRVHLYAGLLLLPWIFLFGLSGMLFNHPNVGEQVIGRPVLRDELVRGDKLQAWDPAQIAARVVAQLNEGEAKYRLDPDFQSELTGFTVLSAPSDQGQHMLLLDMQAPRGVLVTRSARRAEEGSSFPRRKIELPDTSTQAVERALTGMLKERGLAALSELKAHPKIAPELRLRVLDAQGTPWNLSYDLGSAMLSGRKTDVAPNLGFTQLLAKLHTTHHFPLQFGALWLWALFADMLGVTMMFWAVSGLIMWWQLRATRLLGILSLLIALGLAAVIIGGTTRELTFGDVTSKMGPGE